MQICWGGSGNEGKGEVRVGNYDEEPGNRPQRDSMSPFILNTTPSVLK